MFSMHVFNILDYDDFEDLKNQETNSMGYVCFKRLLTLSIRSILYDLTLYKM